MEKHPLPPIRNEEAPGSLLDLETACFMGSNVVSGAASGVVVATGDATYFGAVAKDIVRERR